MTTAIIPDRELDITAELCPMTFVRTRLALDRMRPGQVLLVRLRGKEPLENVPRTARENAQLRNFGANVRRERDALGITQARLAELIGIDIRNVQKIEAGETNVLVTTVTRIRKALGCSTEKLIPRE